MSEKYYTTLINLKNTLEEYGVAIIPNILNSDECDAINKGMWETLNILTDNKIIENDTSTTIISNYF